MPIEYLAGIVDGEGHFCRPKGKNGQGREFYCSRLIIANTYRPLLDAIVKTYGGHVRHANKPLQKKKPTALNCYTWMIHGAKCEALARRMRPFLIVKAEQVKCVLEYEKKPRKPRTFRDV